MFMRRDVCQDGRLREYGNMAQLTTHSKERADMAPDFRGRIITELEDKEGNRHWKVVLTTLPAMHPNYIKALHAFYAEMGLKIVSLARQEINSVDIYHPASAAIMELGHVVNEESMSRRRRAKKAA
jgi:hypothetical protein